MLRWRGRINVWESLELFPASLGLGMLSSSQFVGLSASVDKDQQANTTSLFFLGQQIGMMIAASGSATLSREGFRRSLARKLDGWPNGLDVSSASHGVIDID